MATTPAPLINEPLMNAMVFWVVAELVDRLINMNYFANIQAKTYTTRVEMAMLFAYYFVQWMFWYWAGISECNRHMWYMTEPATPQQIPFARNWWIWWAWGVLMGLDTFFSVLKFALNDMLDSRPCQPPALNGTTQYGTIVRVADPWVFPMGYDLQIIRRLSGNILMREGKEEDTSELEENAKAAWITSVKNHNGCADAMPTIFAVAVNLILIVVQIGMCVILYRSYYVYTGRPGVQTYNKLALSALVIGMLANLFYSFWYFTKGCFAFLQSGKIYSNTHGRVLHLMFPHVWIATFNMCLFQVLLIWFGDFNRVFVGAFVLILLPLMRAWSVGELSAWFQYFLQSFSLFGLYYFFPQVNLSYGQCSNSGYPDGPYRFVMFFQDPNITTSQFAEADAQAIYYFSGIAPLAGVGWWVLLSIASVVSVLWYVAGAFNAVVVKPLANALGGAVRGSSKVVNGLA